MEKLLIINIGELISCAGENEFELINDAYIKIENEKIKEIGESRDLKSRKDYKVFDARAKTVMPGFIDPHTHFVFGGYRAEEFNWRLSGMSYAEIMKRGGGIANTVQSTRNASFEELYKNAKKRLDKMLEQGITTVEGKTGYGLDKENELKQLRVMKELDKNHPVDIIKTFLGAHSVPTEFKGDHDAFILYLIDEVMPAIIEEGGAEFCDVFCDEGVFTVDEARKILLAAQDMGLKSKIHADEIAPLGAAELAADINAISADHLLKISDRGIEEILDKGVTPVLLPITAYSLKEEYAPARKLIDAGLDVALATDLNPGSAYSGSIPFLLTLSTLYMGLTTEEAILALTRYAARAIDREDEIGSIETGKYADIIIFDIPSYKHLSYHIAMNNVELVIKKGEIVYKK